jgi:hypothetical protein
MYSFQKDIFNDQIHDFSCDAVGSAFDHQQLCPIGADSGPMPASDRRKYRSVLQCLELAGPRGPGLPGILWAE